MTRETASRRTVCDAPSAGWARRVAVALQAALWIAAPAAALAQGCDARPQQSQFAREDLRRAAADPDMAIAQDFADRARRELEQLAAGAARCGCAPAQTRFEAAAAEVRRARDAETRRDLRDSVARTVPMFDGAMAALRECAGR